MQFELHGAIKGSTYFQNIQQYADLVYRPPHLQQIAGYLKIGVILLFYTPIQKLRHTVANISNKKGAVTPPTYPLPGTKRYLPPSSKKNLAESTPANSATNPAMNLTARGALGTIAS